VLALLTSAPAFSQKYPNKPVRIVVPFPAGQSTDVVVRLIAAQLSTSLGQQFYIENRAGGAAIIGTQYAAKTAPDGYTLVTASNGPFGINPSLHPKLPYDPLKDFVPVAKLAVFPQVLVVGKSSPISSASALLNAAKASPGKLNFASAGNGSTQHLTMEILRSQLALDVVHVPYKGSQAALTDLVSGETSVMFDSMPSVLPFIQNGQVRALGVSTSTRSPLLPDVPTLSETIAPGFEVTTWVGLAAPTGTPPEIIKLLNTEIEKALRLPAIKDRLASLATTPAAETPEQFGAFLKAEIIKWRKAVRDSGAVSE
jgi:tripartite-type tricarboxylate transporter receptor subunit TctC